MVLHDLLRHRSAVILTKYTSPGEMPVPVERLSETDRHRDVPHSTTLRTGDVTLPVGSLDGELSFVQIHVPPFQGHDLAASEPGFSTEQDDQRRTVIESLRCLDNPASQRRIPTLLDGIQMDGDTRCATEENPKQRGKRTE
jgi:hypothetical protein